MLISDLPQVMPSPHECKVHSCITSNIPNEHGYGQLQPMGWQNHILNLTESIPLSHRDFYKLFYKVKKPYLVRNYTQIPLIYSDDRLLEKYAGNWSVIVEQQNRITHDHREPFWTDWNFSKFLKEYRSSSYYMITPNIPSSMKIKYPSELTECRILNGTKGDERIWMSDGNTSSSLHFDTHDVFLHQIYGMKEIFLWEPNIAPATYMEFHTRYGLSPINTDKVDKIRFPEFSKYQPYFVALYPGDMLYIPTLWWHQLRSNLGRNIMYAQEFELKLSLSKQSKSKTGAFLNTWQTTLKTVPFSCKDKLPKKYDRLHKVRTRNNAITKNCPWFCDNSCSVLNGNYRIECKECPDNFKCSKKHFR
tara:strand:+ start:980 stop:2065 length:1086 start_codon:yes stop_codon:yes gene_type:complete